MMASRECQTGMTHALTVLGSRVQHLENASIMPPVDPLQNCRWQKHAGVAHHTFEDVFLPQQISVFLRH